MKLFKLTTLFVAAAAVSASAFSSNVLDSWDVKDLKDYLRDNSISFDEKKATVDQIKELSKKQWKLKQARPAVEAESWYHPNQLKQQVLSAYHGALGGVNSIGQSYYDVKDWVFNTWSDKDIKKLLKKADIKYKSDAKHSELVQIAKDNYDAIAKHFEASGKYPGDWLYSSWDEKSLKNWLNEYGVDYSNLKGRDELSRKVREYAYEASNYAEDQRQSVLETLDLADQSLFDKAGSIRDDIFNTWTSSQLYNWLRSHKVEVENSIKTNKEELALLAQAHKDDFKKDVDSWYTTASKKASPILSKSSEKVDNVINDTFFVGIEQWSRDRLKSFLESRGVSIPLFATKYQLIELVKENKYKPIQSFNTDDFFQGWSKNNILKWLGVQKEEEPKDTLSKAKEYYQSFASGVEFYASKVTDAVDQATAHVSKKGTDAKDSFFDYWSDVELRNYLNSFGVYKTANYRRDDLLRLAKENTRWFVSGSKYDTSADSSSLSSVKYYSSTAWNSILFKLKTWYNYLYYTLF